MSDEVLVRVDGVGKKFCRSLKKSLWYGVCDIASELNPFGRAERMPNGYKNLTTIEHGGICEKEQPKVSPKVEGVGTSESKDTESTEGEAKVRLAGQAGAEFSNPSASGLARDSENTSFIRAVNDLHTGREKSDSIEKSAEIGEICGKNEGLRDGEFWAVQDVSFELRRGECLGLIGHNGAGKTTLLKMLNGLIKPDRGTITMRGRVGALIALGAGFNPILTGRENIYINGSVLGLTKKEIDAKIDEIIDFAEIREFIDTPVQNYSSGMSVRLGFAVATAMNPDILILDEVLAVGDAAFRNKCYKKISELKKKAAIIFVSHNMEQVGRICDLAIVVQKGRTLFIGDVANGIKVYDAVLESESSSEDGFCEVSAPIDGLTITTSLESISWYEKYYLKLDISCSQEIHRPVFRLVFYNWSGAWVADSVIELAVEEIIPQGLSSYKLELPEIPLKGGKYSITLHIISKKGDLLAWSHKQKKLTISSYAAHKYADCQIRGLLKEIK